MTENDWLDRIDRRIAGWMDRYGILLLRLSLGFVFLLFGALKLFDGVSPAEGLVEALVKRIIYWAPADDFFVVLGVWEVLIGGLLLYRPLIRVAILLLFLQMPGTFLPLVLLPEICFTTNPPGLTLEGQYIIKNLVLITAALVVGGTVRNQRSPDRKE